MKSNVKNIPSRASLLSLLFFLFFAGHAQATLRPCKHIHLTIAQLLKNFSSEYVEPTGISTKLRDDIIEFSNNATPKNCGLAYGLQLLAFDNSDVSFTYLQNISSLGTYIYENERQIAEWAILHRKARAGKISAAQLIDIYESSIENGKAFQKCRRSARDDDDYSQCPSSGPNLNLLALTIGYTLKNAPNTGHRHSERLLHFAMKSTSKSQRIMLLVALSQSKNPVPKNRVSSIYRSADTSIPRPGRYNTIISALFEDRSISIEKLITPRGVQQFIDENFVNN